jgi:hypothetical protein
VSGESGREGGVQSDRWIGVDQAEAVGPDNAHTVCPRSFDEVALGHPAGRSLSGIAAFAKAAADDHEPVDALVPALLDNVEHER